MAATALALYLVWAALAFGWRTWVQLRRTGDSGLRLHARVGTIQWWSKLAFIAALVAGIAAPIAALTGVDDLGLLDGVAVRATGVVLAVAGIVLTLVAQLSLGASWRIGVDSDERTDLVTTGAFARVRNPIFSAMVVTAAGLALMVPNVISIAGFVVLILALEVQVRLVEEPYLHGVHGDRYVAYGRVAGRFVPGAGRFS